MTNTIKLIHKLFNDTSFIISGDLIRIKIVLCLLQSQFFHLQLGIYISKLIFNNYNIK